MKLIRLLYGFLPNWSKGLECEICKKSWGNEYEHHKYVIRDNKLLKKHEGKIPKLIK